MRWAILHCALAVLFLLLLAAPAALAQEKAPAKILWLKAQWPPVFTTDNTGFGDQAMAWLTARLPGYSHEIRSLPLPRLLKALDDPEVIVCTSNLLRTPAREAQYLVSRDLMRMPALSLVVRQNEAAAFAGLRNAKGEIQFRRLMQQAELQGAVNENRSYGAILDPLLRGATQDAFVRLPRTGSMVSMLAANRVDWLLLYPFEGAWLARQEQLAPAMAYLPIAELPAFNAGGVTCNRVPGADRVIATINRLIETHPDEPWLTPMVSWLDAGTRQRLRLPR